MLEEGLSLAAQVRNTVSVIVATNVAVLTQAVKHFNILPWLLKSKISVVTFRLFTLENSYLKMDKRPHYTSQ